MCFLVPNSLRPWPCRPPAEAFRRQPITLFLRASSLGGGSVQHIAFGRSACYFLQRRIAASVFAPGCAGPPSFPTLFPQSSRPGTPAAGVAPRHFLRLARGTGEVKFPLPLSWSGRPGGARLAGPLVAGGREARENRKQNHSKRIPASVGARSPLSSLSSLAGYSFPLGRIFHFSHQLTLPTRPIQKTPTIFTHLPLSLSASTPLDKLARLLPSVAPPPMTFSGGGGWHEGGG
jgi:hypothetical protein